MLFSHRRGLRPATKALQLESIDAELQNSLWSCFHELVLKTFRPAHQGSSTLRGSNLDAYFTRLWLSYFKIPTDTRPAYIEEASKRVRGHFFQAEWYTVYDFIEFTLENIDTASTTERLRESWNSMLERENAGYRIIGRQVVEITNEHELAEVEGATDSSVEGVRRHMQTALGLFADRKNPDYRNSIKESISAVESLCRALTGDSGATLGSALNALQPRLHIHGALKAALSSLYGYTSDEGGIRHAMLEEPKLSATEAKFMLVACSAFINYLISKAAEAGLKV